VRWQKTAHGVASQGVFCVTILFERLQKFARFRVMRNRRQGYSHRPTVVVGGSFVGPAIDRACPRESVWRRGGSAQKLRLELNPYPPNPLQGHEACVCGCPPPKKSEKGLEGRGFEPRTLQPFYQAADADIRVLDSAISAAAASSTTVPA
jgi:hypothetical protein